MAGMKIVVTGGAGFIGSHLVDRLLADGHDVVALDNFDPFYEASRKRDNLRRALLNARFQLVEHDIRQREETIASIVSIGPDAIVHLAARAGVRPSILDPAGYAKTNVNGTIHLLEAAARIDPTPRFVFASSSSVYGDRSEVPFQETDDVDLPVSPYAATKKATELLAFTFHHLYGVPATGLRFFTAYGPRNRPDLAIAKFSDLMEAGRAVPMFGNGSTRRDYTYIDDIVDGVVRAISHCSSYHIYNLGNCDPVALRDMIRMLGEALGVTPLIEQLPEQPGDVKQTYADITRARCELGYEPRTPFSEGLARYVQWRRSALR
jgi:UDP-glucuronate 4-epimerase